MERLLDIMRTLRAPDGCPWDREQTHASLRPYLLEEACEAIDAISSGDDAAVTEELGDVLLQVAFHAVIAEADGRYDYPAIESAIVDKLVRRHPHVFADVDVADADEVTRNWQTIKAQEKARKPAHPADEVPRSLPALMRAFELGRTCDWPQGSAREVIALTNSLTNTRTDELTNTRTDEQSAATTETATKTAPETVNAHTQLGQLLLAVTDYARTLGVNPDIALRDATEARLTDVPADVLAREDA
jgi:MazG family protein